eukprot:CAMPEP_0194213992 /NCGR_PEP_ID=MMETSP0156-20130528/14970_1 /TAXON_ID=33649 /ORGANISM="Thalassionema nitzschioides, Strain L26-B" /LENGTH=845 /DNA_ID=CAMNT_0038942155 /DNA_START=6 /DNA_END=2543 /DNA_ORIENTATION=+
MANYTERQNGRMFHYLWLVIKYSIVIFVTSVPVIVAKDCQLLRNRRMVYFGNMQGIKSCMFDHSLTASGYVLVSSRIKKGEKLRTEPEDDDNSSSKIWPPWPFNLMGKRGGKAQNSDDEYPSNGVLLRAYLKQRTKIIVRQIEHLSRELWFQLPPATPPLMLVALLPEKVVGSERVMPALLANQFVRKLVLTSLGLAVISWANEKLNHRRVLEPLPLPEQFQDISRAFLPPFLPEAVELNPDLEFLSARSQSNNNQIENDSNEVEEDAIKQLPNKVKRYFQQIYTSPPGGEVAKQWRAKHMMQKAKKAKQEREDILEELIALQSLKRKAARSKNEKKQSNKKQRVVGLNQDEELGFALVTGASRGIGRALAVELARWEIPLILVARDREKLVELAADIEKCYGVKCCVLPADLSNPDTAKKLHKTTTAAGLKVDILVNNAGLSSSGEFVDMEEDYLRTMMQVNAVSAATLSHLYGRDMKRRRRGRILMVSSVVGAVHAGPTIAAYAATKAFEKALSLSIAKELEVYGVGVTCLLPGAVASTSFGQTSGMSEQALCWKIPFYAKSSEDVASSGVRALFEGNTKAIPGWQNRGLVKVVMPFLPERALDWIVEAAFNPISYWWRPKFSKSNLQNREFEKEQIPRARDTPQHLPALLNIQEELSAGENTERGLHDPKLLDSGGVCILPRQDEIIGKCNRGVYGTNATNTTVTNSSEHPTDVEEKLSTKESILITQEKLPTEETNLPHEDNIVGKKPGHPTDIQEKRSTQESILTTQEEKAPTEETMLPRQNDIIGKNNSCTSSTNDDETRGKSTESEIQQSIPQSKVRRNDSCYLTLELGESLDPQTDL